MANAAAAGRYRILAVLAVLGVVGLIGVSFLGERAPAPPVSPSPEPAPTDSPPPVSSPSPSRPSTTASPAPLSNASCRAEPLANVYHPSRLVVKHPCITMTGVVTLVRHERDGDIHINVKPDARYAALVNRVNVAEQGGALVVEIVPADLPGCVAGRPPIQPTGTYDYGICTGAAVFAPPVGARVSVTGPYVVDTLHGWTEIHPAWAITVLGGPSPLPATSLRITFVTDPVKPGATARLTARTSAGALCSPTIRYASGRVSSAKGLVQKQAGANGVVSWSWVVGPSTKPGIATATVTCGGITRQEFFTVA